MVVREIEGALGEIERASQGIFSSLASQPVKPGRVGATQLARLAALDETLAGQLEELRMHQARQLTIQQLEADIVDLENSIQTSLHTLKAAQKDLDKIVQESDVERKRMKIAEESE